MYPSIKGIDIFLTNIENKKNYPQFSIRGPIWSQSYMTSDSFRLHSDTLHALQPMLGWWHLLYSNALHRLVRREEPTCRLGMAHVLLAYNSSWWWCFFIAQTLDHLIKSHLKCSEFESRLLFVTQRTQSYWTDEWMQRDMPVKERGIYRVPWAGGQGMDTLFGFEKRGPILFWLLKKGARSFFSSFWDNPCSSWKLRFYLTLKGDWYSFELEKWGLGLLLCFEKGTFIHFSFLFHFYNGLKIKWLFSAL